MILPARREHRRTVGWATGTPAATPIHLTFIEEQIHSIAALAPRSISFRASGGVILLWGARMRSEVTRKKTIAFVDGQNLFHAAKEAFGFTYPNYDRLKLAKEICSRQSWQLEETRFYTGIPDPGDDPFWHSFWAAKLGVMGSRGVVTFSRPLRYRNQTIALPNGTSTTTLVGQEKGIDVRIALDIVRAVRQKRCDVVLVFSQDQDLSEVAEEIRTIAQEQGRWIKMACAFPDSPTLRNRRGINKTDWLRIDRETYNASLDPMDYRKKR